MLLILQADAVYHEEGYEEGEDGVELYHDAEQDALCHGRLILFFQNSHGDRDGEHDGRPQHRPCQNAAQKGRLRVSGQFLRQGLYEVLRQRDYEGLREDGNLTKYDW